MPTRFEEAVRILNDECMADLADYVRDLHDSHEALLRAAKSVSLDGGGWVALQEAIRNAEAINGSL